jgi:hypothetical protein
MRAHYDADPAAASLLMISGSMVVAADTSKARATPLPMCHHFHKVRVPTIADTCSD